MSANPGREPVKTDTLLFINGEHRRGRAGQLAVTDPGSGRDAGTVQLADRADVQDAIDAAAGAFPAWSRTVPAKRGEILSAPRLSCASAPTRRQPC